MDAFVAFFVGMLTGGCLGIMTAGLLSAVRESEDRRERELKEFIERRDLYDE